MAFQKDIPTLKLGKDSSGQIAGRRDYKYLSLDKLMAEVLPLLNKHGLVWMTHPTKETGEPSLRYTLIHPASGEREGDILPLMLDKANSQGLGSAITYARRYALTAVLGIVPDEDDDGAAASKTEVKRRPPAPRTGAEVTQEFDRKMTKEELKLLLDLIEEKGEDGRIPLLLASVGVEKTQDLSVEQGRDLFRKINS